jgi:hypothetical protein
VVASVMKKVIAFMREASQLVLFGVSGDLAHKMIPGHCSCLNVR